MESETKMVVMYGAGDVYKDITDRCIQKHLFDEEKIRINVLFGDPYPGKCKYLCVKIGNFKYIISERYPRTTILNIKDCVNENCMKENSEIEIIYPEIKIVYFAYIKDIVNRKISFLNN